MAAFESPSAFGVAAGAAAGTFAAMTFLPNATGMAVSALAGGAGGALGSMLPQKGSSAKFMNKMAVGFAMGAAGSLSGHYLASALTIIPQNAVAISLSSMPVAYLGSVMLDQVTK